ncbi:MAG TPA: lamin tail domain-containing protein, partial [Telluria sp.]|nr:lamin tail domain-containing protein [Telluria sp.]
MKKLVASINAPGQLTVLAALLAGICAPALAAPGSVVISQVYGGGGNSGATFKNDFIEIFNRSGDAVPLAGWSVQYASAAGTGWAVTKLTAVSLQPGQYLLVQEGAGANGTVDLASDVNDTIAMGAGGGKVALVSNITALSGSTPSGAAIVDVVGYGTGTNYFEGTGPTPPVSNTTAAARKGAGCTDTDNNANDFLQAAPSPRNSSTALNACSGGGPPVVAPIVVSCPASLSFQLGVGAFAALSATDADSIVNGVSITSGGVPGITLGALTAAGAAGGSASVNLNVDASVAAGSYPVVITFTNADAQTKSCTVNVASVTQQTIMQIQGSGATSPFNNAVVTTEGVITVKTSSGFYIQDLAGDNNPATSDAILVFGSTTNFVPGDLVRVTGTITEFTPSGGDHSITEFKNVSAITKVSGGNTITPVNITAPAADLAQYESMLVHVTNPLTINDTSSLGAFGELTLSNGRREVPTNAYPAGSAGALAMAAANAANAIVLGDRGVTSPIPFIGEGSTVRVGDTVTDLVGVVDYGAIGGGLSGFKIQPSTELPPTISRTNVRLLAPVVAQGNVKVASANVLNFFTTFTNGSDVLGNTGQGCSLGASVAKGNCRGADSIDEFNRQLAKIVNELKAIDADVVGLMEIQNNGEKAVSYLVDSLNAAIGAPTYTYVPMPPATGTDAIRVAMIYKPAAVSLVGPSMSDGDAVNNRPPM